MVEQQQQVVVELEQVVVEVEQTGKQVEPQEQRWQVVGVVGEAEVGPDLEDFSEC